GQWAAQGERTWYADFIRPDLRWQEKAACKDMDPALFFPERGKVITSNQAIITCFSCPVRMECFEWKTLSGSKEGVWAGQFSKRGE
ncbi:MAG TPA: WhiB family transcriptional regulator, partial [Candidatus Paceibacterota bacterium]